MFHIRTVQDFDFNSDAYQSLFERSDAPLFLHPVWMQAMQKQLVPALGREACHVIIEQEETNELVGVLPLVKRAIGPFTILEFPNFGVVDHAAALVDPDHRDALLATKSLAAQIKVAIGRYDLVWIKHVREQDLWLQNLLPNSQVREADFSSYATPLGHDYTAWKQERLSSSRRRDLKRKRNKLQKAGNLTFKIAKEPKDIDAVFAFLSAMRSSRFANAEGQDFLQLPFFRNFYHQLAKREAESGFAVTAALYLDDQPIAASFGIRAKDSYVYLLPGADYEKYGWGSPGKVLIDYQIESMMELGVSLFDFSIGDEDYKTSFGTETVAIHTLQASNSLAGTVGLILIGLIKKVRRLRQATASE